MIPTNLIRAGLLALAVGAASLTGGCSASKGTVTLRGEQGGHVFTQSFTQAYISDGQAGEYDVVLVQDPHVAKPSAKGNKPLQPVTAAQLRQVVHIHIFWQAPGGQMAKDGVVTNAAINWYVIGHEESDRPEVVRYEGAGHVMLAEGRKTTSVDIRDGNMKKTEIRGDMQDPIGPALLRGTVKAKPNAQFVRDTLAGLKARAIATPTAVSEIR
jgi:hypothetical protein